MKLKIDPVSAFDTNYIFHALRCNVRWLIAQHMFMFHGFMGRKVQRERWIIKLLLFDCRPHGKMKSVSIQPQTQNIHWIHRIRSLYGYLDPMEPDTINKIDIRDENLTSDCWSTCTLYAVRHLSDITKIMCIVCNWIWIIHFIINSRWHVVDGSWVDGFFFVVQLHCMTHASHSRK